MTVKRNQHRRPVLFTLSRTSDKRKKGSLYRRVTYRVNPLIEDETRDYFLHSTKGYRSNRA